MRSTSSFSQLFNHYRLMSGLKTYSMLGEAMAEEGFIYEDSIFSRWKNNDRIPKDRSVVIGLAKVFIKYEGIKTLDQVEDLLYSVGLRELDNTERSNLKFSKTNYSLPYSTYKPIKQPSNLYQNIDIDETKIRVENLNSIEKSYIREYWSHQIRCGVAEFYSYVSGGEYTPSDMFRMINYEDSFDIHKLSTTFAVIVTDSLTGLEYLVSSIRFVQGSGDIVALPFMHCFQKIKLWPHEKLLLKNNNIAELDRFILPNWGWSRRHMIVVKGFLAIVEYCKKTNIQFIYAMLTQPLVELCNETNVTLFKVSNVRSLYEEKKDNKINNLPQIEANGFNKVWQKEVQLFQISLRENTNYIS